MLGIFKIGLCLKNNVTYNLKITKVTLCIRINVSLRIKSTSSREQPTRGCSVEEGLGGKNVTHCYRGTRSDSHEGFQNRAAGIPILYMAENSLIG
jgi:hypothetical protein